MVWPNRTREALNPGAHWSRPAGGSHLTIYDVALDDVNEAVALSGAAMAPAREAGRLRPYHAGGLRAALRRRS